MALSEVAICNSALAKVGAEMISSLDDANARARLLKVQYPLVRDEMLFSHPWNFAIRRVELSSITDGGNDEYDYAFQLPTDCLRVIDTDIPKPQPWKVEGRTLLSNYSTCVIKYITNDQSYLQAPPTFTEALACKLAADVSYSLVQNASLKQILVSDAEMKLRLARSFDGQESMGNRVYADSWLNERY